MLRERRSVGVALRSVMDYSLADVALLLAAGLLAGMVNAIACGGSLITFHALIAVGLAPVPANVTNYLAVCPVSLASVYGSLHELTGQRRRLLILVPVAVIGSAIGCALLLSTPAKAFELIVPFLVLGAT